MSYLAYVYKEQGRYAEAEALWVETLEIRKRVLSEEHPDTRISMRDLAYLYGQQGQYAEAELHYLELLPISARVLGPEH